MRSSSWIAAGAALAHNALAFPAMEIPIERMAKQLPVEKRQAGNGVQLGIPNFNPELQYVSNKGDYAWVAPGPSDARGPCPGLNAMANHGYIPHNGVATITQFIEGTNRVFGMGLDLGGFLAIFGAAIDGDLTSWSIGGPHPDAPGGNGLIGSHNKYESDVSPTRPDLYEFGNNYEVNWDQWEQLYNKQSGKSNEDSNYDLIVLQELRSERFDQSIANNPYFFNGPFSGVAVQPAAYTFIYRFMSNKSEEHPDGKLTKEVLKSFFGVTENSDGGFSGGKGQERIPDNWYKRAIGDEYTIPFFILDLVQEAAVYPKFLTIGGNTGEPDTLTGVAPEDLTSGLFNAKTLLKGNNLFCFAYQFAQQGVPDIVTSLLRAGAGEAARVLLSLGCPQLLLKDESLLEKFPGYVKSGGI